VSDPLKPAQLVLLVHFCGAVNDLLLGGRVFLYVGDPAGLPVCDYIFCWDNDGDRLSWDGSA
jgi:hypothetical protein